MSNHIANMSLARAFTVRRQRSEKTQTETPYIGRAASQRSPMAKPIKRSQISAPVALISTTNMLSYEAPDIAGTTRIADNRNISSSSSVASSSSDSGHDSDGGSSIGGRSRDTMTDASSVDESYSPISPEPNHLSCYFKTDLASSEVENAQDSFDCSPTIPKRALSHSKKAHMDLSRKRSVIRASQPLIEEPSAPSADSLGISTIEDEPDHPFGKMLEQLNEVQEEYGNTVRDAQTEADLVVIQNRGLGQFCATEYMAELEGVYCNPFTEDAFAFPQWI